MRIYSIRDTVAEEFGPVFTCKNDNVALRNFAQVIEKNNLKKDEFVCYCLGTVDYETGKVEGFEYPSPCTFDYNNEDNL